MNPSFQIGSGLNPIAEFLEINENVLHETIDLTRNDLLVYDESCDPSILKLFHTFGIPCLDLESFKYKYFDSTHKIVYLESNLLFKCSCGKLIKCDKELLSHVKRSLVYCSTECTKVPHDSKLDLEMYYDTKYNTFNGTLLQNCKICRRIGNSVCYMNDNVWTHEFEKMEIKVEIIDGCVNIKDLNELNKYINPLIIKE